MNSLLEQTHLYSKILRRFISRGDKPNKPDESWLSKKKILNHSSTLQTIKKSEILMYF